MSHGKRTLIVSFEVEERDADGNVTHHDHVQFEMPGSNQEMLDGMKEMMANMRGMEQVLAQVKKMKAL